MNAPIEIYGLTNEDQKLANKLWQLDTQKQVDQFIDSLCGKKRQRAITVHNMIILAALDNYDEVDQAVINIIQDLK